jgi:hypothetical protein
MRSFGLLLLLLLFFIYVLFGQPKTAINPPPKNIQLNILLSEFLSFHFRIGVMKWILSMSSFDGLGATWEAKLIWTTGKIKTKINVAVSNTNWHNVSF